MATVSKSSCQTALRPILVEKECCKAVYYMYFFQHTNAARSVNAGNVGMTRSQIVPCITTHTRTLP